MSQRIPLYSSAPRLRTIKRCWCQRRLSALQTPSPPSARPQSWLMSRVAVTASSCAFSMATPLLELEHEGGDLGRSKSQFGVYSMLVFSVILSSSRINYPAGAAGTAFSDPLGEHCVQTSVGLNIRASLKTARQAAFHRRNNSIDISMRCIVPPICSPRMPVHTCGHMRSALSWWGDSSLKTSLFAWSVTSFSACRTILSENIIIWVI